MIGSGLEPVLPGAGSKFILLPSAYYSTFSQLKLDQQLNTLSYINTNQLKSFLANLNGKRVLTDTLLIMYLYKAMICPVPWEGWVGK